MQIALKNTNAGSADTVALSDIGCSLRWSQRGCDDVYSSPPSPLGREEVCDGMTDKCNTCDTQCALFRLACFANAVSSKRGLGKADVHSKGAQQRCTATCRARAPPLQHSKGAQPQRVANFWRFSLSSASLCTPAGRPPDHCRSGDLSDTALNKQTTRTQGIFREQFHKDICCHGRGTQTCHVQHSVLSFITM